MIVKKVSAYPIPCQLIVGGATVNGEVLKVSTRACMVNTGTQPIVVNTPVQIKFVFPVTKDDVDEAVVVYKTYDSFKGKHGDAQPGTHVAEMVFKDLTEK